jgi:ABC-2 type transport system ATP-binding protein
VKGPEVERLVPALEGRGARVARLDGGADGPALRVEQLGAPVIGELAFVQGVVLHELSPRTASLEEAFLQATADAQEYRSQVPFTPPAAGAGAPLPPPEVPA